MARLLPEGYTQVEFLSATGTQYIDTEYKPNKTQHLVQLGIMFNNTTGNQTVLGRNGGVYDTACSITSNQNIKAVPNVSNTPSTTAPVANVYYDVESNINDTGCYCKVNGVSGNLTNPGFSSNTNSYYLFAINKNNTSVEQCTNGKVYYCKIYEGTTLVRDFIPVKRKSDNVLGMFDMVNKVFYTNAGSGTFTAGAEIKVGYKQLFQKEYDVPFPTNLYKRVQYIQSTGTQYIDTGYKPNNNTSVEFDYQYIVKGSIGTARWSGSPQYDTFGFGYSSNSTYYAPFYFGRYSNSCYVLIPVSDVSLNDKHHFKSNKNVLTIDNTHTYTITNSTFQSTQNLYLFVSNNNGVVESSNGAGRLYYYKIWDNDVLVRDMYPVVKNDGTVGMYDTVTKQFYTNAGTGTFIAGEELREIPIKFHKDGFELLEYLESSGTQYIDTGISAPNGFRTTAKVVITDNSVTGTVIGSSVYTNAWSDRNYVVTSFDGRWLIGYGGASYQYFGSYTTNTVYEIDFCNIHNRESLKVNNTSYPIVKTGVSGTFYSGNLYMFANNGSGTAQLFNNLKIYNLKVYNENDVLVRDFIPAKDSTGKPCMYDLVNQVPYYNEATTGNDFSMGPELPYAKYSLKAKQVLLTTSNIPKIAWSIPNNIWENYDVLEFIQSSGTQYIDTGYVPSSMTDHTLSFDGGIEWTKSNGNANFFFGYRSVNSALAVGDMRAFFIYGANPAGRLAIRYGVNADSSTSAISLNKKYNIAFDGTNLKVDGTTFVSLTGAYGTPDYKSMWLFNCNCTGYYRADVSTFSGKIYYWKIYDNNTLVRDLVPVRRKSDNILGMYDLVNNVFYTNQGTGTFTASENVIKRPVFNQILFF